MMRRVATALVALAAPTSTALAQRVIPGDPQSGYYRNRAGGTGSVTGTGRTVFANTVQFYVNGSTGNDSNTGQSPPSFELSAISPPAPMGLIRSWGRYSGARFS